MRWVRLGLYALAAALSPPCSYVRFADGGFQGFSGSGMLVELSVNDTFSLVVVDGGWSFANKFKIAMLSKRKFADRGFPPHFPNKQNQRTSLDETQGGITFGSAGACVELTRKCANDDKLPDESDFGQPFERHLSYVS